MGDGSSVRVWHDLWCGELPLKEISPKLYVISCNRDASVIELLSFSGDSYHWNVSFNRLVQDWELECIFYGSDLFDTNETGWNE